MELSKSIAIEWHKIENLRPHPTSVAIYGEDSTGDLVESVKALGILEPLYIKTDGTIISGHRRWRAAKQAGLTTVPCVIVDYADELDEKQSIIEHNRYRIKTGQQLYNEGKALKEIEAEKARLRQLAQLKNVGKNIVVDNCPQREERTRDIIAKAIGLGSGRQWHRLEYVAENMPDLLPCPGVVPSQARMQ